MKKMIGYVKSFNSIIRQLNFILNKKQKKRSFKVFINMIIASILDTLGIAAILPFISALTNIEIVKKQWYTKVIINLFHIDSDVSLVILVGIGIILIYVIKNLYLYIYQIILIKYQCSIQKETSVLMLNSYMSRPYSFFRKTNSSVIMRGIDTDATSLYSIISNLFLLMTQVLTIILIGIFLVRQDAIMALGLIIASIVCVVILVLVFKSRSSKAGNKFSESNGERINVSYQIVNGIKEIFVMQRKRPFITKYEKTYTAYCDSQIEQNRITATPIRIIETTFIAFVIGIVCVKMAMGMNPIDYVPQLATFAVAGFRLIPMVTAIPNCMNGLIFSRPMLNEAYENINSARKYASSKALVVDKEKELDVAFNKDMKIDNICYRFDDSSTDVLHNLSLDVKKGESIGIIGESGAGKSTLVDIIMGLQKPTKGKILVDGIDIYSIPHRWSRLIGYIPQSIFIFDDTIRNNVLFGLVLPQDDSRVWNALNEAHIASFVKKLPDGLDTVVGESGVRLSGGQRQRLAIARVMYNNPSIIVMDEATSALDNDTEKAVMESIDNLSGEKTLIIVAHRLTTVKNCNHIYEIKNGKMIERRYSDIIQ
jgi:ABC-type bacteriocin/lantibiotic exporter with double-glycine peptidase domain